MKFYYQLFLKIYFQVFKTLAPTCFRLHHRLQNSSKDPAISSWYYLKSIREGNLYLGPLHIIDRTLQSVIIFKSQMII